MKAYVLVEVDEESEEQLKKTVVIVRRSLHELQSDVGVVLADLPYYEHQGPKTQIGNGPIRYLSNHWELFRLMFEEFRKQPEKVNT